MLLLACQGFGAEARGFTAAAFGLSSIDTSTCRILTIIASLVVAIVANGNEMLVPHEMERQI